MVMKRMMVFFTVASRQDVCKEKCRPLRLICPETVCQNIYGIYQHFVNVYSLEYMPVYQYINECIGIYTGKARQYLAGGFNLEEIVQIGPTMIWHKARLHKFLFLMNVCGYFLYQKSIYLNYMGEVDCTHSVVIPSNLDPRRLAQ